MWGTLLGALGVALVVCVLAMLGRWSVAARRGPGSTRSATHARWRCCWRWWR